MVTMLPASRNSRESHAQNTSPLRLCNELAAVADVEPPRLWRLHSPSHSVVNRPFGIIIDYEISHAGGRG